MSAKDFLHHFSAPEDNFAKDDRAIQLISDFSIDSDAISNASHNDNGQYLFCLFRIEFNPNKDLKNVVSVEKLPKRCISKMDLIIILDASSSRENVFEHQQELALSLIERLQISSEDTHVATGVNSFTDVPTLRQTLGLGRDRNVLFYLLRALIPLY